MKKTVIISALILVIVTTGFLVNHVRNQGTENMNYSSFMEAVNQNQVDRVTFSKSGNDLEVNLHSKPETTYTVPNPKTDEFTEFLLINDITVQYEDDSLPAYLQIPLVIIIFGALFLAIRKKGNGSFKVFDSNKNKDTKSTIQFHNIAGNLEAKGMVEDMIHFLKNPQKYSTVGARMPKGILLYGPPGTGKTMMAKAIAGEADVPFYAMSGSDFVQMYVGVGASRIRNLFQKAKKQERAVIFIDEIDAIGKKRARSLSASNDERDQTLNALLTEMSGFQDNNGIIVIGATNRLDTLDEALLRPGRFDRQVEIGLPDVNARKKILSLYMKEKPCSQDVDLDALSKSTVYFSGAMLENLINEAAIHAANENQEVICQRHIDHAFYTVLVGAPKQDYSFLSQKDRKITAYHEAGHALITRLLLPDSYISKITIIPSSNGAGGFNLSIPKDTLYQSQRQIKANIQVLLGGRIAEELIFGKDEITTGASNDIKKASSFMLDYINKFGMDSDMGLFSMEVLHEGADQHLIEKCRTQMNVLYEKTRSLMNDNLDLLERIAAELLEKESMNAEDMDRICTSLS